MLSIRLCFFLLFFWSKPRLVVSSLISSTPSGSCSCSCSSSAASSTSPVLWYTSSVITSPVICLGSCSWSYRMRIVTFLLCICIIIAPFSFGWLWFWCGWIPNVWIFILIFLWMLFICRGLLYKNLMIDNWLIEWFWIRYLIFVSHEILILIWWGHMIMLKRSCFEMMNHSFESSTWLWFILFLLGRNSWFLTRIGNCWNIILWWIWVWRSKIFSIISSSIAFSKNIQRRTYSIFTRIFFIEFQLWWLWCYWLAYRWRLDWWHSISIIFNFSRWSLFRFASRKNTQCTLISWLFLVASLYLLWCRFLKFRSKTLYTVVDLLRRTKKRSTVGIVIQLYQSWVHLNYEIVFILHILLELCPFFLQVVVCSTCCMLLGLKFRACRFLGTACCLGCISPYRGACSRRIVPFWIIVHDTEYFFELINRAIIIPSIRQVPSYLKIFWNDLNFLRKYFRHWNRNIKFYC